MRDSGHQRDSGDRRERRWDGESGHQAVGHVLLVSVVAGGTLAVARLSEIATAGFERLLTALS